MSNDEKSLLRLVQDCSALAIDIVMEEDGGMRNLDAAGIAVGDEPSRDDLWAWADGVRARRIYDLIDGRCSLLAIMKFDLTECCQRVEATLTTLQAYWSLINEKEKA